MRSCDSSQFSKHSFKDFLCSEIMNDVIRATVAAHNKTPGRMEWRVLVVDTLSMKMVSACTKMHELSAEGITSKKANDKHVEVDKILFSCGDCDQEERTHASYGGKITVKRQIKSVFFHQAEVMLDFKERFQSELKGFQMKKGYFSLPSFFWMEGLL